jgi:hypothetical protein
MSSIRAIPAPPYKKNDRRDHHLDQLNKPVLKGFIAAPTCKKPPPNPNRYRNQVVEIK